MNDRSSPPSGKRQADVLRDVAPGFKKGDISSDTIRKPCPHCGKRLRIEEVVVLGQRDNETVKCPACKNEAHSAMCFSLSVALD